ncbi:MAG: tetratricopeptide repeat protein [Gemmataceae bacterium]|nr:tetratricopeptide repeat protein [Gemmataceae bacterium]
MDELLAAAVEHHQRGRLDAAERGYRAVLAATPDHPDALHLLGVAAHQRGRHAEAADLIGRAVALRPDAADYHANLAEVWRALGQPERAADACRAALRLRPDYPEAANNLGLALLQLGQPAEAVEYLRQALALRPAFALAHNNLGDALRAIGDTAGAIDHFRAAVRLAPDFAEAHSNLGQLLAERRQLDEALAHAARAVELRPDLAEAQSNLGNVLRELGRADGARRHYAEALRLAPNLATVHGNLGQLHQEEGRLDDAIASYQQALALDPGAARIACHLGTALAEQERYDEAAGQYEAVLRTAPDHPEALHGLGVVRHEQGRDAEAVRLYRAALAARPDFARAAGDLAATLEEVNDLPGAEAALRAGRSHDPDHPALLAQLATLLRGKLPDDDLAALRAAAAAPHLRDRDRADLHFALAQVLDARREYAAAADHLTQANALDRAARHRRGEDYDPDKHTAFVSDLIAACTPAFFDRVRGLGLDSDRPVFVVGLPRSGTTLVEQVLASHPRVHGAGELRLARDEFESLPAVMDSPDPPAGCLARLDRPAIEAIGRRHLDRLAALNATADRVVDKMPDNYLYLGLLAAVFPRAAFVHCRRDLRDIAVSCWMTNFRKIRWANDPDHIAARFADYRRLCDHWRAALPVRVLEVNYEETVADLEGVARRLVAWCGLDWDPACLRFHEAARPVRTASVTQVRRPVYGTSVARWRHYEPALADLFARLAPDGAG